MRVLVTGQSGLNKNEFLTGVISACKKNNVNIGKPYDLEDVILKENSWLAPNYLDKPMKDLLTAKNDAIDKIIRESKSDENVILAMHLNYYRNNSLYQILEWKKLREFKPDLVVTLIDDIYGVKHRIEQRNDENDYVRAMSLKDISWWREAEISTSKNLADNLMDKKIPHYIIARAHGSEILYQLMFESVHAIGEKGKKIVYASYPITLAKTVPILKEETNNFIDVLKKYYIVFIPGTIKEKMLHDAFVKNFKKPIPDGIIKLDNEQFQINEVAHVIVDINGQIITRDERLIDQSDMIIAYRPAKSIGSRYEVDYALKSGSVRSLIFHPDEDGASPFSTANKVSTTYEEFLKEIPTFGNF